MSKVNHWMGRRAMRRVLVCVFFAGMAAYISMLAAGVGTPQSAAPFVIGGIAGCVLLHWSNYAGIRTTLNDDPVADEQQRAARLKGFADAYRCIALSLLMAVLWAMFVADTEFRPQQTLAHIGSALLIFVSVLPAVFIAWRQPDELVLADEQ